jgi:hypothetical protein
VRGKIVKVHRRDINYKGHIHRASPDEPQYEIKSDKTDHIALHKAAVLRRLGWLRANVKARWQYGIPILHHWAFYAPTWQIHRLANPFGSRRRR